MITEEISKTRKVIDALEHQEFVDWRFEEWIKEPLQIEMLQQADRIQAGEVYGWLRSAFHAGAKQ